MALLSRLRSLLSGHAGDDSPDQPVAAAATSDEESSHAPAMPAVPTLDEAELARVAELRAALDADPNDAAAFAELAELVRRAAAGADPADPLTADSDHHVDPDRSADLAIWSLAEELAGRPKAWFPLVELARLSLPGDLEGAVRRLSGACERETDGTALIESVRILREAGRPADALNLGVGHWVPARHGAEAGRQVILAALEAGRAADAKRLLADLDEVSGEDLMVDAAVDELRPAVDAALDAGPH